MGKSRGKRRLKDSKQQNLRTFLGGFGGAFRNLEPPIDPPESLYELDNIMQRCWPKKKNRQIGKFPIHRQSRQFGYLN